MHKQESILKNEANKILWDFEIQMDHLILARRPDLVLIIKKKRTNYLMDFTIPADRKMKIKESEKIDKFLNLNKELKNAVALVGNSDTSYCWCTWNGPQRLGKRTGRIGNHRKN